MIRSSKSARTVVAMADLKSRLTVLASLKSEPGFDVVGEASDWAGLLALGPQVQPDILLLDSVLADCVDGAASSWAAVRIILLASVIDEANVVLALRLAARAIVPRLRRQRYC